MDPVGVVILIAGVIALVLSTTVIFGRVPARVKAKAWYQESPGELGCVGPSVHSLSRGRWFCRSTRWSNGTSTRLHRADFATFQYGQKVLSDFWTAVTVALESCGGSGVIEGRG